MSGEITLPVGATAEKNTCGSCKFFRRYGGSYADVYRDSGSCGIKFPPFKDRFVVYEPKPNDDCDSWGPTKMKDSDGCDFWRDAGKSYIVQRKVG